MTQHCNKKYCLTKLMVTTDKSDIDPTDSPHHISFMGVKLKGRLNQSVPATREVNM